jgi:hypothetical protein
MKNSSYRNGEKEIVLVGSGEKCYLWAGQEYIGPEGYKYWTKIVTFSGPQKLRAIAKDILRRIPEKKVMKDR